MRRGDRRRFTSERGAILVLVGALAVVVGGTRCSSGPSEGATCNENQVGTTYADPGGCKSLVCDGKAFGSVLVASGDPCSKDGLTCPPPDGGVNGCPGSALVCDGTQFAIQVGVGPGAACNQAGLVCRLPDSECDTCTCDGTTFHCQENCCVCDGGPPSKVCPASAQVVAGQSCNSQLTCPSDDACEAGVSSACTCISGIWVCQCS